MEKEKINMFGSENDKLILLELTPMDPSTNGYQKDSFVFVEPFKEKDQMVLG